MFDAAQRVFTLDKQDTQAKLDAAIFTAAVADFRPASRAQNKVKKTDSDEHRNVQFVPNPDILATLAADKGSTYVVGFAAETQNVIEEAQRKLKAKNADLIVANDVSSADLGFASTHNRWHFVTATGVEDTALLPKRTLAKLLMDEVAKNLAVRHPE
jgi:phosphopantothenoylcysteine decarboxylase/phosphopantothenate--cysteine ligase